MGTVIDRFFVVGVCQIDLLGLSTGSSSSCSLSKIDHHRWVEKLSTSFARVSPRIADDPRVANPVITGTMDVAMHP
jgi:hypothetical protein